MKSLRIATKKMYNRLDRIFTKKEAWGLFKLVTILETIGWSFLIIGIVGVQYHILLAPDFLALSRSFFGIVFVFYIFIIIFAHRSMGWGIGRLVSAGFLHILPYGSLGFWIWAVNQRNKKK